MEGVKEHYANLLARHYTWMFGKSFEEKVAEQKFILEDALRSCGIGSVDGIAVDLGCGPGYQSIALAQLGFSPVTAIDTSAALLNELREHSGDLPLLAIEDDILRMEDHVAPQSAQVVVCMGDTITHVESRETVLDLLSATSRVLVAGGLLIITYRDLSEELGGVDRFIPVQADDQRILTCFLEFDDPERVTVHDLLYTRLDSGWRFDKSSYRKLRLSLEWLENAMASAGFEVSRGAAGKLVRLVGRKQ